MITVGVEEDGESLEVVLRAEHIAYYSRLLHIPQSESISEQISCT